MIKVSRCGNALYFFSVLAYIWLLYLAYACIFAEYIFNLLVKSRCALHTTRFYHF